MEAAGGGGLRPDPGLHSPALLPGQFLTHLRHGPVPPGKGQPGYHSLWHGRGENLQVVSSEPLEGIGCSDWQRIPELGVVTLERTPSA